MSHEVKFGLSEFLTLCPDAHHWTGSWETGRHWMGLKLEIDGIYIVPPPAGYCFFGDEAKLFAKHPQQDLTKPLLSFPCSLKELENFAKWLQQFGELWTEEQLEREIENWYTENESPEDFAKRLRSERKAKEEVAFYLKERYPELTYHMIGRLAAPEYKSTFTAANKRGRRYVKKIKDKLGNE